MLGQKLLKLIVEEGKDEVLATGRGPARFDFHAPYQSMDISDIAAVADTFNKFKPDALVNTAAMTNVDQCELNKDECRKLNIEAVEILLKACKEYGTYFLHLSTDFILAEITVH